MKKSEPNDRLNEKLSQESTTEPLVYKSAQLSKDSNLTRRGFLKGGFASGASLAAGGCGGGGSKNTQRTNRECSLDYLSAHSGWVHAIAFNSTGSRLATASADSKVKIWNVNTGQLEQTYGGHSSGGVAYLRFSPDDSQIASVGANSEIHLWDVLSGNLDTDYTGTVNAGLGLYFSDTIGLMNDVLMTATKTIIGDKTVTLWDADTGNKISTYTGHGGEVTRIAFNADGSVIATGGLDSQVHVWNRDSATPITSYNQGTQLASIAFSPDGNLIASVGTDNNVHVWDSSNGNQVSVYDGVDISLGLAFSPDSERVASGAGSITDASAGNLMLSYGGHRNQVQAIAFKPDVNGSAVASAGRDETVQLWNSSTGLLIHHFEDDSLLGSNIYDCDLGDTNILGCQCDIVCNCDSVCSCDTVCDSHSPNSHYWFPN